METLRKGCVRQGTYYAEAFHTANYDKAAANGGTSKFCSASKYAMNAIVTGFLAPRQDIWRITTEPTRYGGAMNEFLADLIGFQG